MEINLNDSDIEKALTQYVSANVAPADGVALDIKLSATRNPSGFKATVTFIEAGTIAAGPEKGTVVPEPQKPKATAKTKTTAPVVVDPPEPEGDEDLVDPFIEEVEDTEDNTVTTGGLFDE